MIAGRYHKICSELEADPRRWLVTGAAGFIGSHLVQRLLGLGQQVVGLDNLATGYEKNLDEVLAAAGPDRAARFTFIKGSIADRAVCDQAAKGVEYVLHQAALGSVPRSIAEPERTNEANVTGFLSMLTAARDAGAKRFVYASSSAIYGDGPGLPKVEAVIGNCLSPYAVSKRVNELYAKVFNDLYRLETAGLRYFNVFGPRQDPAGAYAAVIPKWIDLLSRDEQCICYGDGETSRDFCFVDNVVQANILAACAEDGRGTNEVYNVALGDQTTLTQLFEGLRQNVRQLKPGTGSKPLIYEKFRDGDVRHSRADVTKISELLGYVPEIKIDEGIKRTVSWFLQRRHGPEKRA